MSGERSKSDKQKCLTSGAVAVYATGPVPIDVTVDGCDMLPCRFTRGSNISSSVTFKTPGPVTQMNPFLNVQVGGVWMNFDAGQKDGCDSLVEKECPLKEGEISTYVFQIPIQNGYPKIRIKVEHLMLDALRRPVFCYGITGKVIG
ncbi:NPC intracellular cholesterol transporter 2-like [Hetaerina americana]|uniref:NPC intracellular cholesterol transporter 2-like n=1 Tax=Hetaerina americana TaxID=62018 RepID=UPI003A7F569A